MLVGDLGASRLRANGQLRLVPYDEIDGAERAAIEPLSEDADFYGVLVPPPGSALPVRSVSRDAALVFLSLREPARIPHLLSSVFGANAGSQIRQLVIDGVLEVECDGAFVSGASAFLPSVDDDAACYVARLSREAIAYGAALGGLPITEVASRMYLFNRMPSTPALQRRFATTESVLSYLVGDAALAQRLQLHWTRDVTENSWVSWRSAGEVTSPRFKLYVSPTLEALPEAFRLMVDALARTKCTSFKAGLTAFGLLRSDKLVAYFSRLEDLQAAAELISVSASGIPAHGVPFTGAIDAEGLVTWGMDPPRLEGELEVRARSWRQWVADRVAVHLAVGRESGSDNVPEFALRRLRMDGVDVLRWSPNMTIWRDAGSDA